MTCAIKALANRLTEAEWIADLLQHGLLRVSFVPDRELLAQVLDHINDLDRRIHELDRMPETYMAQSQRIVVRRGKTALP